MLVRQSSSYCHACNTAGESIIVDVDISMIKVVDTAMECKCGYFRTYKHTSLDFSSWQKEKSMIEFRIANAKEYVNSRIDHRAGFSSDSDEYKYMSRWIKEEQDKLDTYLLKDKELGNIPIPNILFNMVKLNKD